MKNRLISHYSKAWFPCIVRIVPKKEESIWTISMETTAWIASIAPIVPIARSSGKKKAWVCAFCDSFGSFQSSRSPESDLITCKNRATGARGGTPHKRRRGCSSYPLGYKISPKCYLLGVFQISLSLCYLLGLKSLEHAQFAIS